MRARCFAREERLQGMQGVCWACLALLLFLFRRRGALGGQHLLEAVVHHAGDARRHEQLCGPDQAHVLHEARHVGLAHKVALQACMPVSSESQDAFSGCCFSAVEILLWGAALHIEQCLLASGL